MKIRDPRMMGLIARLGVNVGYAWMSTLRYQYLPLGENFRPQRLAPNRRIIYAFWHENILMPAFFHSHPKLHVLISTHRDGQLITDISKRLGFESVRGSSTRGGAEAIREMVQIARKGHIAITPDGPQGPRRRIQSGAVYIASRTGLPIAPIGFAYRRVWRAKSWDRFAIPVPFSKVFSVSDRAITIPPKLSLEELEVWRRHVEDHMHELDALAEEWAAGGRRPQRRTLVTCNAPDRLAA